MVQEREKIKIGVIDIGHSGNYHLQKYSKLEHYKIDAVADALPG